MNAHVNEHWYEESLARAENERRDRVARSQREDAALWAKAYAMEAREVDPEQVILHRTR